MRVWTLAVLLLAASACSRSDGRPAPDAAPENPVSPAAGEAPAPADAGPVPKKAGPPQGLEKIAEALNASVYRDPFARAYIRLPRGYAWVPVKGGLGVHYPYAFRHQKDAFEVRFHFAPMTNSRKFTEALKPGEHRADLDKPHTATIGAVQFNMGAAHRTRFLPFPAEGVRAEFAADWGWSSPPFELDPEHPFAGGHRVGSLHQIHRTGAGDIVLIQLASDADTLVKHASEAFYSARFIDPKEGPRPGSGIDCPSGTEPRGELFPIGRVRVCMRTGTMIADGPFVEWHAGGAVKARGVYKAGKIHGWVDRLDHKARLVNRAKFRRGKPHGPNVDYYPGGQKATESRWKDGVRAGEVRFFDLKGKRTDEETVRAIFRRLTRQEQLRELERAKKETR